MNIEDVYKILITKIEASKNDQFIFKMITLDMREAEALAEFVRASKELVDSIKAHANTQAEDLTDVCTCKCGCDLNCKIHGVHVCKFENSRMYSGLICHDCGRALY